MCTRPRSNRCYRPAEEVARRAVHARFSRRPCTRERRLLKPLVILLLVPLSIIGQESPSSQGHDPFLVRISEDIVSILPTAGPMTVGNCMLVNADGHAHLELRRQEFYGRGTLTRYKARLNETELKSLRDLLNAASLKALPPFIAPHTPLTVPEWHDVVAEIPRGAKVQHAGFFESAHPASSAATVEVRAQWSSSAVAMHSLVEWFHAFKSDKRWVQITNRQSSGCGQ